jgi:hypothetical protein
MFAFLTVVRYPKLLSWAGFLSMAYFRLPLLFNKRISFYKLMGCGRNGTFDKVPDLQQWAILAVSSENQNSSQNCLNETDIYGKFINRWWKLFRCTKWTIVLKPIEGHGNWDGKEAFGALPRSSEYDGPIAVLTRATIRPGKLKHFWRHVDGVAKVMTSVDGFITSIGIGEVPWIKQATFSVWKNKESLKTFAYKMKEHVEVVKKTRQEKWYSEDMFVRFKVVASHGSLRGDNPLAEII